MTILEHYRYSYDSSGASLAQGNRWEENNCAERLKKLQDRKSIAASQGRRLYGADNFSIKDFERDSTIQDVAGATGVLTGTLDSLGSVGGVNTQGFAAVSAFTFTIQYGDAVGTAIGEGIYGDTQSYGQALGEVGRQGAIFAGSSFVGYQMVKTPTPVTVIGGLVLIGGDMAISSYMNYVDSRHASEVKAIHQRGRSDMKYDYNQGVNNLNADIDQWNKDCVD